MSVILSQAEADSLLDLEKRREDDTTYSLPDLGGKISAPLVSLDGREPFLLDITRSHIRLTKITYQTRARNIFILARLDLDGAPHRNPDDTEVGVPHLHLYREGYGDKWAYPVPLDAFSDLTDSWNALQDFMKFCSVIEPPFFEAGLFS